MIFQYLFHVDMNLISFSGMKVFVEMACNGLFGAGKNDQIQPPDSNKYFVLKTVDLVVKDHNIQQLITDFEIVIGLAKVTSTLSFSLLYG